MALNFPTSPTDGLAFDKWSWNAADGVWLAPTVPFTSDAPLTAIEHVMRNGVWVAKREARGAFPAGLTYHTFTVPSGAVGAKWRINHSGSTEGAQQNFSLRVTTNATLTTDATDFPNLGNQNYGLAGTWHNTGTNLYQTSVSSGASFVGNATSIQIGSSNTSTTISSVGDGWISLRRPSTAYRFACAYRNAGYNNAVAGANVYQTWNMRGWVNATPTGIPATGLAITGLRFSNSTSVAAAPQFWVQVEWMY